MNLVPAWIQILQALMTPLLAIVAGYIGYRQWHTAHQKIMLDLFDRRLNVYSNVRSALTMITSEGVTDQSLELLFEAEDKATFLFGEEIRSYLVDLWSLCVSLPAEDQGVLMRAIDEFYERGADRFAPYMRMDQKQVRSLREWLSERNRIRLSYADEKQK
ncbi:hypothetical protein [Rhizobium sp. Leaf453]|uniref:hypothetical protein n=1 Tax=Rhizobium sp. Leaf453 TaxID=1736380 RepID=UPI000714514F|nr:hypothetical protein [Rhizobium sp. Leaf453]KQT96954.1 hypothetical protein ASG68_08325 [Rhizobium sp. Leaf453]